MMDPSSAVQQGGGVEHVLQHNGSQHHADLGNVDPHMGVLSMPNNVHNHMLAQQVSPVLGYMHSPHSLAMPPSPSVHMVPNPVSQVSLTGSPYVHPGLMQEQTEKYGPLLFHKDDQGLYTCFFTGCGKKLKANFSRHVAKHEMDGDKMDPTLATQIQTSSASKNLGTTKICSHPTHQEWWGTSAEQPVTEFYKRCSKCKKCYIRLQQESKRLRIESINNSSANPVNFGQPFSADMFGHVNNIQIIDQQHLKRDTGLDDEQGPAKRMRMENSPQILAHLEALTDKHFKEMAELTARHSANSRKLIAENTAIRMNTDIRHNKQREELELRLRNEWDQFRHNCLKEREDLYQSQLIALERELNGASIPTRACRLCNNRMYSTFLYQCNLCNEEACIRCQAVMVCGVCGIKSCENCTIKHNWLIWCNRCHKTFCTNDRSVSDDICPGCERKGMDLMLHPQHQLPHHGHLQHHELNHQSHLHHPHHQDLSDLHHEQYSGHHHPSQEELMSQQIKFEELGHDDPHGHPHHQYSSHDPHLDPQHMHAGHHMDHHLQHEHLPPHDHHLQHHQYGHLQHDHLPHHEHIHDHHLQHHSHTGEHHYQEGGYGDLQHMPSEHMQPELSEHSYDQQNYDGQQDYQVEREQANGQGVQDDLEDSQEQQEYQEPNHYDSPSDQQEQSGEQNQGAIEDHGIQDGIDQSLTPEQERILRGGEPLPGGDLETARASGAPINNTEPQSNPEPYQYAQEPEEPDPNDPHDILPDQPQAPPNDPNAHMAKYDEVSQQQPIP